MQENEIKKYEMFRLGPDPYFIGYAAILLIPEIIALSIAGFSNNSIFGRLPFWLLTCLVLTMLASLATGIAYANHKADESKAKITPLLIVTGVIALAYVAISSIGTALYSATIIPLISLLIGFVGLGVMSIHRKNWVSLFFSAAFISFVIASVVL